MIIMTIKNNNSSNNSLKMFQSLLRAFSSVQFSRSVVSSSLLPHVLQHARIPCLSPTPGACSNSCPSSQWCHPTISSSVIPFSSRLQSSRASGSFPRSQFFKWVGQSIFSISPSNEYSGLISFRMDWLDLLAVQGTSPTPKFKSINSSAPNFLYNPTLTSIHDYWKNHSLTRWTFVSKVMFLLFNILSRLVIAFLPRSKHFNFIHHLRWFWSPGKQSLSLFPLFPHVFAMKWVHHAKCRRDDSQAGIKITRRNINNLIYADDTTLMAERKEELKSLLMKVKE